MPAAILALSTAVPSHTFLQSEAAERMINLLSMEQEKGEALKRTYQNSAISKRHSVIGDFHKPREEWEFWGSNYPYVIPGMSHRNTLYKQEAPRIAQEASEKAIACWGESASKITHIISVSCTGIIAPGIEYYLMQNLGLPYSVNRLGINFMGCFGAFKGLSVARAFALENSNHRILLVCTELCSLHLQVDQDNETLVANSLFADGAAAAIIGADPHPSECPLWEITRTHCVGLKNSINQMTWEASDRGFLMRLSHRVPALLGRHIQEFTAQLLAADIDPYQCDWAIHPGGKSILQAIEKALKLNSEQTKSSWEILANYGNLSSATFLFVLDHLARQKQLRSWSVGLAFGPGLSIEGLLLKTKRKV